MNDRPGISLPLSLIVGLALSGSVIWAFVFMCIFGGV